MLDSLEHGGEEIAVLRNGYPVAKLVPGAPRMTALEALSDLHHTLDYTEGEEWIQDAQKADRLLVKESRDPWE